MLNTSHRKFAWKLDIRCKPKKSQCSDNSIRKDLPLGHDGTHLQSQPCEAEEGGPEAQGEARLCRNNVSHQSGDKKEFSRRQLLCFQWSLALCTEQTKLVCWGWSCTPTSYHQCDNGKLLNSSELCFYLSCWIRMIWLPMMVMSVLIW